MKSLARSQSARRRAAATAALASVGAGILGTHSAEAAIVTIDIGPSGFNIEGVNAGGYALGIPDFPISGGGLLGLRPGEGPKGASNLYFATNGTTASPFNFSGDATIGSSFTGTWSTN